ncbi:cell division cycle 6 [Columba livia]|uniref:Cell division cycle 6 n=1 Tax=Columba livia TaxID=8932 RepID=A0A2I0LL54_COLLI|nr:cell division cycle 6 [Columba livia]
MSPMPSPAPRPSAARRTKAAACSSGTPRRPPRSPAPRGPPHSMGGRRPPGVRGSVGHLPAPGSSGRKVPATSRRSGCCMWPCPSGSTPGTRRPASSGSSCGTTSAGAGPAASTSPEPPGRGKQPV